MADSKPKKKDAEEETSLGRWLLETAFLVLIAFALAQGIKAFLVQPFVIPTGSMIPTIALHNRVLAEKISYHLIRSPEYGDIVVFKNPMDDPTVPILIKRVVAVGGQTVDLKDGSVYVDGKKLNEPYTHGLPSEPINPSITYPFRVPNGDLWVMGDNRTNSGDSRYFGPVPVSDVVGHAFWTYWPPAAFGALH